VAALQPIIAAMIAGSNTSVTRYDMTQDARNYLENYYTPTGDLKIPVVSVHNMWDPLVPIFHEDSLSKIVGDAGTSGMLLRRAVPNYGHCNFPTPLVVGSFQALSGWVTTGTKPAS